MKNHPSTDDNLAEKQQQLLLQIQKSHRLVVKELYSNLYVVIMVLVGSLTFYFLVFDELWTIDLIIFLLNTSLFALVALNNIRMLWPFWKKIDQHFAGIKEKTLLLTEPSILHEGISSYVNTIQSTIQQSVIKSKVFPEEPPDTLAQHIKTRFNRSWFIQIVIGIIIVLINHLVMVFLFQPQGGAIFWLYVMYSGILLTYGVMVVRDRQVKLMFQRWLTVFSQLDQWAESLELMPIVHDVDELPFDDEESA
ncbi:MAG: hypothetical protein ACFFDC_16590 [Promethearchaeota archaeon]